jgi:hypothetical protein
VFPKQITYSRKCPVRNELYECPVCDSGLGVCIVCDGMAELPQVPIKQDTANRVPWLERMCVDREVCDGYC